MVTRAANDKRQVPAVSFIASSVYHVSRPKSAHAVREAA